VPIAIGYVRHFNNPASGNATVTAETATGTATGNDPTVSAGGAPTAPTAAFTLGTQAGVPTGTSLTNRSALGSPVATESFLLTEPVTAATANPTVSVWRNIRFTQTVTPNPGSGQTYLFENCSFEGAGFWNVEIGTTNARTDKMQPLVIFNKCSFDGGSDGTTDKNLVGGFCWVIDTDMRGAEDAWAGWAYNVAIRSNFVAHGADIEMHSDGVQCLDTGRSTFYRCWISAGTGPGASQAFRCGTEAGAIQDVGVYYCGIDRGGYAMQLRGDAGAGDISDVTVQGCRWTRNHGFGPIDVEQTTGLVWTDNAYFDGEVIPAP
jgi:hypothetical protein